MTLSVANMRQMVRTHCGRDDLSPDYRKGVLVEQPAPSLRDSVVHMITEAIYVGLIADLLNRDPNPRVREKRVREANRALYRAVVSSLPTTTPADLALSLAARRENNGQPQRV